jgi:hypothetical protein
MKAVSSVLSPLPEVVPGNTFATIKAFYMTGVVAFNWMGSDARVIFATENVASICAVMTAFNRYLLSAYNALFVENDRGVGRVTAINEVGIRVVYFAGEFAGNHEWIHADSFQGNMDATPRKFKEQPVSYLDIKRT